MYEAFKLVNARTDNASLCSLRTLMDGSYTKSERVNNTSPITALEGW